MKNWKSLVVVVLGLTVAFWAMWVGAGDTTPGLVRLEGQALDNARAAKTAHAKSHQSPGQIKIAARDSATPVGQATPRAAGTIQYDTGAFVAVSSVPGFSFGNRFNSALNVAGTAVSPVQLSGSVTGASWGVIGAAGATNWGAMWITVYDQLNTTAGTAQVVGSNGFSLTAGPYTSPLLVNAPIGPWNYSGSSFLMGMYNYNSGTTGTTPKQGQDRAVTNVAALIGDQTTGSPGFHGYAMSWGSTTGNGYTAFPSVNVIMRATGNVVVPVELMGFTVE